VLAGQAVGGVGVPCTGAVRAGLAAPGPRAPLLTVVPRWTEGAGARAVRGRGGGGAARAVVAGRAVPCRLSQGRELAVLTARAGGWGRRTWEGGGNSFKGKEN
jgi:hypothetical protein